MNGAKYLGDTATSSTYLRISEGYSLVSPRIIREELPLSAELSGFVASTREKVSRIFDRQSPQLLAIVGPCSIHNPESALEYARKLSELAGKLDKQLLVVMRCYLEKPRSILGWKGLIYDPDLDDTLQIQRGIRIARKFLIQVLKSRLPVALEMVDPMIEPYIVDCVSYVAIGARTSESQMHRQLASALPMPVGFKNSISGSIKSAVNGVVSARHPHSFAGVMDNGTIGMFRSLGNPYAHPILRGGINGPNYFPECIKTVKEELIKAGITPGIIIDCSHANSNYNPEYQHKPLNSVIDQLRNGEEAICGIMLESFLQSGSQKLSPGRLPAPDCSVTDGCISWEETKQLLYRCSCRNC